MSDNKRIKLIILLLSLLVLIVFLGATLSSVNDISSSARHHTINFDNLDKDNSVNDSVYNVVMSKVADTVMKRNNLQSAPDVIYRNLSLTIEKNSNNYDVSGIIDVPSIKQSYILGGTSNSVFLICPPVGLTNYPDSFCIGAVESYEDDSIYALFGLDLPMNVTLDSNVKARIYQKDHKINVHLYTCESENLKVKAKEYIEKLIADRGGNPSIFPITYSFNGCR